MCVLDAKDAERMPVGELTCADHLTIQDVRAVLVSPRWRIGAAGAGFIWRGGQKGARFSWRFLRVPAGWCAGRTP